MDEKILSRHTKAALAGAAVVHLVLQLDQVALVRKPTFPSDPTASALRATATQTTGPWGLAFGLACSERGEGSTSEKRLRLAYSPVARFFRG